jgi:hypothetical protein
MYENSDDMTDGKSMESENWTGVFGMLQRREVDFALIPITMSSSRIDAMDFTIPAMEMRYCHVYRLNFSSLSFLS